MMGFFGLLFVKGSGVEVGVKVKKQIPFGNDKQWAGVYVWLAITSYAAVCGAAK